jgi:hypothetical protein
VGRLLVRDELVFTGAVMNECKCEGLLITGIKKFE